MAGTHLETQIRDLHGKFSAGNTAGAESVSVAQLVNATVHATGTGGQTTLRFSSGDVWFAY